MENPQRQPPKQCKAHKFTFVQFPYFQHILIKLLPTAFVFETLSISKHGVFLENNKTKEETRKLICYHLWCVIFLFLFLFFSPLWAAAMWLYIQTPITFPMLMSSQYLLIFLLLLVVNVFFFMAQNNSFSSYIHDFLWL